MKNKINVGIMGGTGYAAAELIRLLLKHPNVNLTKIASIDHVGKNVGTVHRNFGNNLNYTFENIPAAEMGKHCELVFLSLPHTVSAGMTPELIKAGVKIIDLSGDYRILDVNIYNKYYKTKHPNPESIKNFVYGLPELNKAQIKEANYIANPGCFPTATALSILPLAKKQLLSNKVRVIGPTGSSGSGVAPQEGTHHPTRVSNLKSYKPLTHQHQPEMEQTLSLASNSAIFVDFIPMSAPLSRGILINSVVDLDSSITEKDIDKIYKEFYQEAPFIRYLGNKNFPEVVSVRGSNYVEVGWSLREDVVNGTKTFAAISAIDNLVKGASGQAIQNMNLMYNFGETTGIDSFGVWP